MCTFGTAASVSGMKKGFLSGTLSFFSTSTSWSNERYFFYPRCFFCLCVCSVIAGVKYFAVATRISLQISCIIDHCFLRWISFVKMICHVINLNQDHEWWSCIRFTESLKKYFQVPQGVFSAILIYWASFWSGGSFLTSFFRSVFPCKHLPDTVTAYSPGAK